MNNMKAFPFTEYKGDGSIWMQHTGMDLRDYFAAQVLAGMLGADGPGVSWEPDAAAEVAYEYADSMMEQRLSE